jgi:hypothetical protein
MESPTARAPSQREAWKRSQPDAGEEQNPASQGNINMPVSSDTVIVDAAEAQGLLPQVDD